MPILRMIRMIPVMQRKAEKYCMFMAYPPISFQTTLHLVPYSPYIQSQVHWRNVVYKNAYTNII